MEGNKDEAQRCVELAEKYLAEGKYDKAEKFLLKGQKLFPTTKAERTCKMEIVVVRSPEFETYVTHCLPCPQNINFT